MRPQNDMEKNNFFAFFPKLSIFEIIYSLPNAKTLFISKVMAN